MSVRPLKFEELVGRADLVMRTEVLDTRCVEKGEGASRRVVTLVRVRVEKVLVGQAPSELELELLGGDVSGFSISVPGMPKFVKGDRDVLFVAGNGRLVCPLVGVNHGRFLLVSCEGKEVVARADHTPLKAVDQVGQPLRENMAMGRELLVPSTLEEGLTVDDFELSIIECAKGLRSGVLTGVR